MNAQTTVSVDFQKPLLEAPNSCFKKERLKINFSNSVSSQQKELLTNILSSRWRGFNSSLQSAIDAYEIDPSVAQSHLSFVIFNSHFAGGVLSALVVLSAISKDEADRLVELFSYDFPLLLKQQAS